MKIDNVNIDSVIPYANNPRNNSDAVDKVAASIQAFGWQQPIVVDENMVVIVGHTRLLAAKKLGLDEVPVQVADKLTEGQAKAYRLADNRTNEYASWDIKMLGIELCDLDDLGFDLDLTAFNNKQLSQYLIDPALIEWDNNPYTSKIDAPIYEPSDQKPIPSELRDRTKADQLIKEIKKAKLSKEIEDVLCDAAERHVVFRFDKLADFYAHSSQDIQNLMEESALVVIDFNKAIENGFVNLESNLDEAFGQDYPDA